MCARYLIDENTAAEMRQILSELDERHSVSTGEIYPTNIAPIICHDGVTAIQWGFPQWTGKGVIINARSETALEKVTFRKPMLESRCVVPCSGFFEWQSVAGKKKKAKYFLNRPDKDILYLAGAYSAFRDADDEYLAFVILTTAASASVAEIHDRMPVILDDDDIEPWLNDTHFIEDVLRRTGSELQSELYR
jgi:Uncharacterized conserved protein